MLVPIVCKCPFENKNDGKKGLVSVVHFEMIKLFLSFELSK